MAWRCVDKALTDYPSDQDRLDLETILRMTALFLKAVKFIHIVSMCRGGGRDITFGCMKSLETTEEPLSGILGALEIELANVDIWRTGCMLQFPSAGVLIEVSTIDLLFLFTPYQFWYLGEDEILTFWMIGLVERLPSEWDIKWQESRRDVATIWS
ncbi:uncharacterized protein N7498_003496 [Penicillium cinerascens]|uniref:Uncharacterized protein n=1 Tax=Penicillium cinerascens TaxID=70096 RepID=A0A9W9T7Y2_9EURO|nr:uncharacterized protein N7498_003496 [Penicillium cinerascens]KAJ5211850.1 hypothetical protein N7498_003496 [Penicillium cinerascens]